MWRVTAVVVACLLGGLGGAAPGGNEEKKLTWAEVLGVPAPTPLLPAAEYEYEYYDDEDGDDDDFFANHDYEYVDTADPSYTPPPPPPPAEEGEEGEEGGEGAQTADRRTLDLLYHWFMADPKKPSRPSLIEEVFRTIDNHIIEDLREWNANAFPHLPHKPVLKADGHRHAHAAPAATPGPALAPAASDDTLLVTDELGREHVVTINDIVTSLGHLDEQTLVDLLLGPPAPADKRSSTVALPAPQPPQPPPALPQGTNLVPVLVPKPRPLVVLPQQQQQQPIVLATLGGTQGELARPVRHTGPPKAPPKGAPKDTASLVAGQDDDVYVVQDESGAVQVVTLQDILSSLSALDSGSVNQLLFGAGGGVAPLLPIPSAQGQVAAAPAPAPTTTPTPPPAAPSVNTDFDGNIHVQARPGTVTVDLRSHDWEASAVGQGRPEGEEEGAGGSVVRRDDNGDIHISPAPGRPFTLDVRNIIALAEQAEQAGQAGQATGKGVPSKSTHNRLSGSPTKGGEEAPSRGQELLSFLTGVDALPTAIPPSAPLAYTPFPAPAPLPSPTPSPAPGLNQLLLQALGRPQPTTPAPTPAPRPSASAAGGLGATLSGFLSRLVGGGAEQPSAPQVEAQAAPEPAPAAALSPQQEYVQLVLRQQKRQAPEAVFGDVVIPLPQPIHHRAAPPAPAAPVKREAVSSGTQEQAASQEEEEEEEEEPAELLAGLSPRVLDTLRHQLQSVPRFVPPALRRAAHATAPTPQPPADARADHVPDNEIQRLATAPLESLASYASSVARSPSPSTASSSSSVPQLLSKLPSESLRKLLLQALQRKSSAAAPEPTAPARAPLIPDKPQDRSSYAELPDYSSGGGYSGGYSGGYGYGHSGSSTTTAGDDNPLFDLYFLADATSLYKIGDTNLSLKTPKIGSPKNFVDTRHPFGYHYGHHQPHYGHHQQGYGYPTTYGYH